MYSATRVTVSIIASEDPAFRALISILDGHAFSSQYFATGLPSELNIVRLHDLRAAPICPIRTDSCQDHSSIEPFIPRLRMTVGGTGFEGCLTTLTSFPELSQYSLGATSATIPCSSLNVAIS